MEGSFKMTMVPIIVFMILSLFILYFISFRILVHVISGGMFALLLIWLPDVIAKYVFNDLFGTPPSILLYLLSLGAIIVVVFLCVEKNLQRNKVLDISLGLGLLTGLFVNAMRLFFAR
jgi:hypothetical protein